MVEAVERPSLHIVPQLCVPLSALETGLVCRDMISLTMTCSLPDEVTPAGGIKIRQPYPNQEIFVGGARLMRNGWLVPIASDVAEFDIELHWRIQLSVDVSIVSRVVPIEWHIQHVMHVKLERGTGFTYSMDDACWPHRQRISPVTPMARYQCDLPGREITKDPRRQVVEESDLVSGYFIEENLDITGITREEAWTIDAFQNERLHEDVCHAFIRSYDNEAHRANGPVEMPPELLLQAIKLVQQIPFDDESDFSKTIQGVPGGYERHPAMKLLCDWWETVRPEGEPCRPGMAMPLARVCDNGQYEWPPVRIDGFNKCGRDAARIGDFILVLFQAKDEHAAFDDDGMHVVAPSGRHLYTVGYDKEQFLNGEVYEAWYCLEALADFPELFPLAWDFLERQARFER
jgi:hypothetical protein